MKNTKRKTVLLLLALSLCTFSLSGCWDQTEVNDLAIITAAGLDLTEDHQLELSIKMTVTSPSGAQQTEGMSDSSGGGGGQSIVRSVKGKNMADAASKLQQVMTRKVFWGQDEVFIFGERLAKEGLSEPMNFLLRHPGPRERANLFVSKGSAKAVLELDPPVERSVADALRSMAKARTGLNITMKELAQMMTGKANAAVIPLVEIKHTQKPQDSFPFIHGTAILKNGKMIDRMNAAATRGILWLRNEINRATVTVSPKNSEGTVSVQLLRGQTKLVPHIHGDDWAITAQIDAQDDIIENTTDLDLTNPQHIEVLKSELQADINRRVRTALAQAQKKMKADIFQFADAFYRQYPKEWNRNKGRWDEIYPKVEVRLQTNVKIGKSGLIGQNLF